MPRPCSIRPIRDGRATEPVFRPASHTTLTRLVCSYCIAPSLTFKPPMVPKFRHSRVAEVTTTFLTPWNWYSERLIPRPALPGLYRRITEHPGPRSLPTQPCNRGPIPAEETVVKRENSSSLWVGGWRASLWNPHPFLSTPPRVGIACFQFCLFCLMLPTLSLYEERVCLWVYTLCAFIYFYICILHSNRDFMHRIKRFPPISLGLSFCWIIQLSMWRDFFFLDKFTILSFPFSLGFLIRLKPITLRSKLGMETLPIYVVAKGCCLMHTASNRSAAR